MENLWVNEEFLEDEFPSEGAGGVEAALPVLEPGVLTFGGGREQAQGQSGLIGTVGQIGDQESRD